MASAVLYSWFAPPVSFKRLGRVEKRNSRNIHVKADKTLKSERKAEELILPDLSENLFCTVVLTGPSFAYLTCKWHGNTCTWGLWRLDDCEDEMFLSTILRTKCAPQLFAITFALSNIWPYGPKNLFILVWKSTDTPSSRSSRLNPVHKVRSHLDHLAWMQNVMYKMVLRKFSLKWCPSIYHKFSSIAIRILLYITSQFAQWCSFKVQYIPITRLHSFLSNTQTSDRCLL